jgi:hypothetical protein
MADFVKGGLNLRPPFGVNEYLRSTQDVKYESYTVAKSTIPATTVFDGTAQKILDRGVVMAKITSGADAGKVGPFQAGVTDGRQTAANIVGLNDTFLPWQLLDRDVEIAVAYECTAVQGWCKELIADGTSTALTNTTADAMRGAKGVEIHFH